MKKLLREPLLWFLLLGAGLFAANVMVSRGEAASSSGGKVIVTRGQIESLVAVFERTWQRAPTSEERNQLVEAFVRDEVFYREGVALGLDRDDALIRRRIRQKVELLAEEMQERAPSDAELQAYLDTHRSRFMREPRLSFRQVYLNPAQTDRNLDHEAVGLLKQLRRLGDSDAAERLGDSTMLAPHLQAVPLSDVARDFGDNFAAALATTPTGQWQGPVPSAYGLHLVFISARTEAQIPALIDVRSTLEREWSRDRQAAASDQLYQKLRHRYEIEVEEAAATTVQR